MHFRVEAIDRMCNCRRQIARLQRDFDVNLDAAALMTDLMEEVRQLRRRLGS